MSRSPGFEYTVRRSARARHVRIAVSARDGVVVVVPDELDVDVADVVGRRTEWVETALARIADRRAQHVAPDEAKLPDRIEFAATGDGWPVEYRATAARAVSARVSGSLIVVSGDVDDAAACLAALRRLVTRLAVPRLSELVDEGARIVGRRPGRIRIGAPRSRWGSCSGDSTVSLSRNLVFLPHTLAMHVVLHELVHLEHRDHSARFHARLAQVDPDAVANRRRLKTAHGSVPVWAEE